MEKKKQSGKINEPRNVSRQKIFGQNKLQISEEGASWMVGCIVEKGISEKPLPPSAAPNPVFLPFPVARHRSHGPHWAPVGRVMHANDENNEDDANGEDDNFANFNPLADFAKPVQRTQKKGLDFSSWRALTQSSSSPANKTEDDLLLVECKKQKKLGEATEIKYTENKMDLGQQLNFDNSLTRSGKDMTNDSGGEVSRLVDNMDIDNLEQLRSWENSKAAIANDSKDESSFSSVKGQIVEEQSLSDSTAKSHTKIMEEVESALPELLKSRGQKTSISAVVSSSGFKDSESQKGSMTLESEIDAENHSRLQSMSVDEIAHAQAEIMEKMDPALLEVLKRRGQDKLKKQKSSSSDLAADSGQSNLQKDNNLDDYGKGTKLVESDISPMATNGSTKDMERRFQDGSAQNSGQGISSLWKAWSQKVEAVRHLRFSLDGTVINNDAVHGLESGENSSCSGYSADNVAERDFLRTEGDPGAAGYTIKEAVALTRSVVPAQRAMALHILAAVLDTALHNIHKNQVGCTMSFANNTNKNIDWEAVWAFALGPEPELVLSLRVCLDDNHSSVVLACARVVECILSCDMNENFFDLLEKTATYEKDIYTAPVFRSRPEVDTGFLHGGYWKYNAKPSNIIPYGEDVVDEKAEENRTIQDDIVVAGQDVAAGLIRMGILSRICYLLETDPTTTLEACLISVLLALARHSPTCANAIIKCPRLVQTVANRFSIIDGPEIHSAKIRSVTLLKVLARSDKKVCMEFIKNGVFQNMMWHLYRPAFSIDHWIKLGRDHCKVASALMVEQLRFWKVCIHYGYCVSYFADFFPSLCLWLNPPAYETVMGNNVLHEFASISAEAYLVLAALSRRLPSIYSQRNVSYEAVDITGEEIETWSWSWSCVGPMVDLALKWVAFKSSPCVDKLFDWKKQFKSDFIPQDSFVSPLLWVIAAVMRMLFTVLERVKPDDTISLNKGGGLVPWLPEFVPRIGLEIIRNSFLSFSGANGSDPAGGDSFVQDLCYLRHQSQIETSLGSVCSLFGLVRVVVSIDSLIRSAKKDNLVSSKQYDFSREGKILEDGILNWSLGELRIVLNTFMKSVASEWHYVQSIETFGRGGPAPGVGLGWGASGGGFWSETVLLAQTDAGFLLHLLGIFQIEPVKDAPAVEEMTFAIQRINSAFGVCLTAGPRDRDIVDKALDTLLQVPALKCLYFCVHHFVSNSGLFKIFQWDYKEEDFLFFSKILTSHFRNRWLSVKLKVKAIGVDNSDHSKLKKGCGSLDTIPEHLDTSSMTSQDLHCTSLVVEWAHQRLPLPMHWFLSPISTIYDSKHTNFERASDKPNFVGDSTDFLEVAKAGLLFLLGIEAMSSFLPTDVHSPVQSVPLIWKLHSLSVILIHGMGVLEEGKSRDVYEALQELYARQFDESRFAKSTEIVSEKIENSVLENKHSLGSLRFQSEIHESYSTFIETLVEQFSAISFGDLIYGRQVAIYLLRCVESPVRLAAWTALSNIRVLELLPPLEKCLTAAEGYLEPVEDDEHILEAYVKSWVSGAVNRAATRRSVAYTLVLHHLSSFIFQCSMSDKLLLRNKLGRSLLRDYSRKHQHEGMMLDFIHYNKPSASSNPEQGEGPSLQKREIERRLEILTEACERNSTLLTEVEKLKCLLEKK